jgi:hypothetical protein
VEILAENLLFQEMKEEKVFHSPYNADERADIASDIWAW